MPTIGQAYDILTGAGLADHLVRLEIAQCRVSEIRQESAQLLPPRGNRREIGGSNYPWRTLMEHVATPAIMTHIGVRMINSALWYALTRNLARILSERRPADTRALLLRDARATWLARGCTVEQWELIYLVETGLMHLDISGEDR